jgi:uncharacterized membrane protein HdeD (DUF308 family)
MFYTNVNIGKYFLTFILYVFAGILLFVKAETLTNFIIYLVSFSLLFSSISKITILSKIYERDKTKETKLELIYNFILLFISILLLFMPGTILFIAIGLIFVVKPILEIINAKNNYDLIYKNIVKIIVAVFLIVLGLNFFMNIIYKVFGVIFLLLGINTNIQIIKKNKEMEKQFNNNFYTKETKNTDDIIEGIIIEEKNGD